MADEINKEEINQNNENTSAEKGGISVEIEHLFPIIKKWLYSDKEIFLREIVSNAADAVTKLNRLVSLGEVRDFEPSDGKITVSLNKTAKTITVSDNGIGMSSDELRKYICNIALSGALDFIEKYEGSGEGAGAGIIGHFGLGFYSAFMVSDTVDVISASYTGTPAVKWVCGEDGEYELIENYKRESGHGTDVVMHISSEGEEFLETGKLKGVLEKYCAFMSVPIFFVDEEQSEDEDEHECDCENKDDPDHVCEHDHTPNPVNDTHPLWLKNAADCTNDEYREFYQKVFSDYREPLFQIHLNADYPLNFKGILYFPRITSEYDSLEGQVKLYYNQVFVADNIKEVIPEYLLMLKGVLDCPELPLNVSRSYLQNSGYVAKISAHITKKVADKLNGMFTDDREAYAKIWRDLKTFVEYGCMRDKKFYDRVKSSLLFETTDGEFVTVAEYLDAAKDSHENTVYYAADKVSQAQYISLFNAHGIKVALFDRIIDTQFIQTLEHDTDHSGLKFVRVDADIADSMKDGGEVVESEKVRELFKGISGSDKLTVKFERLKDAATPALLNISEQSRRFEDMMAMYRMAGEDTPKDAFPTESTLILNAASPLIEKITALCESDEDGEVEKAKSIATQLYTLCLLSQRRLSADELKKFLSDSYGLLGQI